MIRLTRTDSKFEARTLTQNLLEQATSKPRSGSEVILEGLLSNAVMLCEAEGDRIVYESTYGTFEGRRLDIRFVPCEGTGGFTDSLRLYIALDVPSAVIADIDFLAKERELRNIHTELVVDPNIIGRFSNRARQLILMIRSCLSDAPSDDIHNELFQLAERAKKNGTN